MRRRVLQLRQLCPRWSWIRHGEVGGGDPVAARPRRRQQVDPCHPPQRPAPVLPQPPVVQSPPSRLIIRFS